MPTVTGPFDVTMTPQGAPDSVDGTTLARLSLDKRYRGELDATATGEMLSAVTGVKGSAGYVALERVRGTLAGRLGTFVLQHTGVLARGAASLTITVVPDSGSGALVGLAGSMNIVIEGGRHSYVFDYTLPEAPSTFA
jgi:hypothetical protein